MLFGKVVPHIEYFIISGKFFINLYITTLPKEVSSNEVIIGAISSMYLVLYGSWDICIICCKANNIKY